MRRDISDFKSSFFLHIYVCVCNFLQEQIPVITATRGFKSVVINLGLLFQVIHELMKFLKPPKKDKQGMQDTPREARMKSSVTFSTRLLHVGIQV